MEIPNELCKWLIANKVFSEQNITTQNENEVILDEETSQKLEIGISIPLLLRNLQTHTVKILGSNIYSIMMVK